MGDLDAVRRLQGESLRRLLEEVRREFFTRRACEGTGDSQHVNSVRIVTIEVYDSLSVEAQIAAAADLIGANEELVVDREPRDIFTSSDTPQTYIADLVCEVVCQSLMDDPLVILENEARETLFE